LARLDYDYYCLGAAAAPIVGSPTGGLDGPLACSPTRDYNYHHTQLRGGVCDVTGRAPITVKINNIPVGRICVCVCTLVITVYMYNRNNNKKKGVEEEK